MTPKEKAQELVDKFSNVEIYISIEPTDIECQLKHTQCDAAKQCAIIAVDEIIKLLVDLSGDSFTYVNDVIYYQEVKHEIKKL
jgi:hypothetical protein